MPKPSIEQPTKAVSYKATKRRIMSDDESDNTVSSQGETSLPKPPSKKPRLSKADGVDPQQDTQSRPQSSKPTADRPRVATGVAKKPPRKKKRIISDDEDDGDEFVPEPEEKPGVGTKSKNKELKGKIKPGPSGGATSRKAIAKDESLPANSPASNSAIMGKKRGRTDEDDVKDPDVDVDVTSVPPAPVLAPVPDVEPPKKKLPTIKKKSKTDSATGSTFVSPVPGPPPKSAANTGKTSGGGTAKPPPTTAAGLPKKPAVPVQATTMNPSGTGDFDLRDSNIWQSLIGKGTSSSGPRVGIEKRVSTEERRKQLDKMRDEARARREEQYRHTFDLQAQSQKIAAFERKFSSHKIRISGPNVLGAAFKARPIPRS